jgi:hydrogenase maturation protease
VSGPRVIIGIGNLLRADDGAGRLAASRLRERLPSATVHELEAAPPDLFDRWDEASHVVVVDAAHGDRAPGTLHRFDARAEPLPAELMRTSTHAGGLAAAVELARALERLPASLVVYAIEGQTFDLGGALSPPVARAIDQLVEREARRA